MNISNRRFLWTMIFLFVLINVGFVSAQMLPAETTTPQMDMPAGPSISNVSVKNITDTSAEIDVNSDELVQGYVEYGTSEQYGMSTPLTAEFSTSPSFILENLSPETLYHYRVVVMDSAGNVAITGDETFTTFATPAPAPKPTPKPEPTPTEPTATTSPTSTTNATTTETDNSTNTPSSTRLEISNTETASVATSTARIMWQTNKNADAQVEYGKTNTYGTLSSLGVIGFSHSISLSSLSPNTKYYYRAISKTSSGEIAHSPVETFTTLAVQVAPTYPVISNVTINPVGASNATISWTTSKSATSDIQYGTTTSYTFSIGKDSTFTSSHSRMISNLSSETLYHFRIVVVDNDGNTVYGKDRTFTTAKTATASSESTISTTTSTTVTTAPTISTTTSSNTNSDILSKIAKLGAKAPPQGGGGLPVAPSRPLLLNVTALDGQVVFDWRKDRGGKNGTIHTLIVRKQGTDFVRSRIDGNIIYDGPSTTFTDTNVVNGIEYHYALYSYGRFGRFTVASHFKIIPRADKEEVDISATNVREQTVASLIFSRDLFLGKQGDDVAQLQKHLSENGFYPEALITGYFGVLTQQAVMRFQKLNAIYPVAGYIGPLTREVLMQ